jgi:hypothetical protein
VLSFEDKSFGMGHRMQARQSKPLARAAGIFGLHVKTGQERGDGTTMDAQERADLERQLNELKTEHRDLDEVIGRLGENPTPNQLQIRRLKKRKLTLKDQIERLQSRLLPDIIA